MKKNILTFTLLALVAFSATAKEGHINPYWFGDSIDKSASPNDNLNSINNFLDGVVDSTVGALNEFDEAPVAKATRNGWHLAGFQTSLGIGLSGSIGIVSFGGTKSIEIDWKRSQNAAKKKEEELEKSVPTITLNENSTKADLNKSIDPIIKHLVDTGRISDEKEFRKNLATASDDFYAYTRGLATTQTRYVWRASKIRLDMSFSASGKFATGPVTIKLGADVRVRLEFARLMDKPVSADKAIDNNPGLKKRGRRIAKKVRKLLDDLSYETTKAYDEFEKGYAMESFDMEFNTIAIGIGISLEGKIGVVSFKGAVAPTFFFKRHKVAISTSLPADKAADNGFIPLLVDNSEADVAIAKSTGVSYDKGIKFTLFKLKKKKIRKGMQKAMKFAAKFSKSIHKKSVKRQRKLAEGRSVKQPKWLVKKIKSAYAFSIGGTIGPVKIKGKPVMELYWTNKAK